MLAFLGCCSWKSALLTLRRHCPYLGPLHLPAAPPGGAAGSWVQSSVVQHGWPPPAAWVHRRVACPSLCISLSCSVFCCFFFFLNGASKGNEHPLLHFRLWSASNSKPSRLQTWWHQWKISSLASGDKLVSKCSRTQTVVPHYLRLCAHSVDGPSGFCV